jgi:hypothetical protein
MIDDLRKRTSVDSVWTALLYTVASHIKPGTSLKRGRMKRGLPCDPGLSRRKLCNPFIAAPFSGQGIGSGLARILPMQGLAGATDMILSDQTFNSPL